MNRPDGPEGFVSTPGLTVVASFLLAGSLVLYLTGSRASSILFLVFGLGTGAWVAARSMLDRRTGSPPPEAGTTTARPSFEPAVPPTPVTEELPTEKPAPRIRTPLPEAPRVSTPAPAPAADPRPTPITEPATPLNLQVEDDGPPVARTVRIESLLDLVSAHRVAHFEIEGDGAPREVWYGRGEPLPSEIVIGRAPGHAPGAIPISSKAVSAVQARLVREGDSYLIENVSKTNVTRVAGRALLSGERRSLASGDLIEVGPVRISYHFD